MSERPTEFVVQRSKWLRGRDQHAFLLNGNGYMCCLGFVALQSGLAEHDIAGRLLPSELGHDVAQLVVNLLVDTWSEDTDLSIDASAINDDDAIDDAEREAQLTVLFAEHGFALRFEP